MEKFAKIVEVDDHQVLGYLQDPEDESVEVELVIMAKFETHTGKLTMGFKDAEKGDEALENMEENAAGYLKAMNPF